MTEPAGKPTEPAEFTEPTAPTGPILLQVRPRKITILASIAAGLAIVAMVVIGLLLRDTNEGVEFRTTDQVGLIGVGLVLGGVIMTAARPRLRVDQSGLWIRNVLGEQFVPWQLVVRVAYPQGAPWAQVLMPDDEIKPLMAIQAMDRGRAVTALDKVRELQASYGPPPPAPAAPPPELRPQSELAEPERPLGRLEIIDRQKAAARERDLRAKREKQARKAAGRSGPPQ
jgi:hypothetical protein